MRENVSSKPALLLCIIFSFASIAFAQEILPEGAKLIAEGIKFPEGPAISRDGSSPSNGKLFNRGKTRTSSDGSSAWTMPPSRSALFSSSARNTNPSRPDFFHCSRRCSASMPEGEDDEIAVAADFLPFLVAPFLVAFFPDALFLPALVLAAPRAPTFLLFFTRLPSSFDNPGG